MRQQLPADRIEHLCLDDEQLDQLNQLASRCEQVYGPARDIEWAFAGGTLYLLQCRAVTTGRSSDQGLKAGLTAAGPVETLQHVPLFAELEQKEVEQIARLFKERRFAEGETVVMEGSGARPSS